MIRGPNGATWKSARTLGLALSMRENLGCLLGVLSLALSIPGCAMNSNNNYAAAPPPPPSPPPAAIAKVAPPPVPAKPKPAETIGLASWYGPGMEGHKTATGERFSSRKLTAAAKNLPLGARVIVTNPANGRTTKVRINDCGPFKPGRNIDLSKKAARQIGIIHDGTARVKVNVIAVPPGASTCDL